VSGADGASSRRRRDPERAAAGHAAQATPGGCRRSAPASTGRWRAGGRIVLAIEASLATLGSAGGLDAALRGAGVADAKVATVVLAHELIWEIAELLVAERKVERPSVALDPTPSPAALGELMFVAVDG
jgi:hypothetical protein